VKEVKEMALALEGIKVLDVSQVAAVPMAARHLADFGADVLHIENPATGDSWRVFQAAQEAASACAPCQFNYNWENFNRNKRSVTIDLSQEDGRNVIYKMVEQADVFLTNLRLFELERFKLEYETLSRINPGIIFGNVSGYGKTGPDKNLPAYDATAYQVRSGIPSMISFPGIPTYGYRPAIGDNVVGLALAYGIMVALFVRDKTGVGQEVDVSLLHTALYHYSFDIAGALATGMDFEDWREAPPQEMVNNAMSAIAPVMAFYGSKALSPLTGMYITKDLRSLVFVILQPDRYWVKFCRAISRDDLADDPKYASTEGRAEHSAALRQAITESFLTKTLDEWIPLLEGIPYAPMQGIKAAVNDPQARESGCFVAYDHPTHGRIEAVANPVLLSKNPATVRMPAPEFGQHTEEALLEYGYSWEDIAKLKEGGVIA
jgi:crotonobetainyl-CoA:carnitine CoA-transferase CaiB-like acyl-CoA transferase